MRHLREVEEHGPPRNILAQAHGQRPVVGVGVGLKHVPERNLGRFSIRYLDPDGALAGNGRQYPDFGSGEGVGDVLLQIPDLADLHPAPEAQLVTGDPRPDDGPYHVGHHPEVRKRLGEPAAGALGVVLGVSLPQAEQRERRRCVLAWRQLPPNIECLRRSSLGKHDFDLPRRHYIGLDFTSPCWNLLAHIPHDRRVRLLPSARLLVAVSGISTRGRPRWPSLPLLAYSGG